MTKRKYRRRFDWRRAQLVVAVVMASVVGADEVLAHGTGDHLAWRTAPHLLGGLLLIAGIYGLGVRRLWRRAGMGTVLRHRQVACFGAGWLVLFAVLVSPVDMLAEQLSSVHMVQHLSIMLVSAPLMVLGAPGLAALWALPRRWRVAVAERWRRAPFVSETWAALSQPLIAWLVYFVVLWGWHLPSLYEAALANRLLHDLQHLLFFGSAALVWWVVLNPLGGLRLSGGAGVLYLFTTSLHAMALGVFMTLSPAAWYPIYASSAPAWGLEVLQDQQIAGAIMWMPAALAYVVLAALIFLLWMKQTEAAATRLERVNDAAAHHRANLETMLFDAEEVGQE